MPTHPKHPSRQKEPQVKLRDQMVPISQMAGLLWNCSDILPGYTFDQMREMDRSEEVRSATYGAAARWMERQIAQDNEAGDYQ